MYVMIAVHRPKPGQAAGLLDAMQRRRDATRLVPGIREVHALYDAEQNVCVGLAIWESQEAADASWPALREVNAHDDFSRWEDEGPDFFRLVAT